MELFYLSSNENQLQLYHNNKFERLDSRFFLEIYYYGRIYGLVKQGIPIATSNFLDLLRNCDNIEEIIELIRFLVGSCWIIIKRSDQTFTFISSASAPPLYLYLKNHRLFFTPYEDTICAIALKSEKVNPFEMFDILNTKRFDSVPYGAILQNISRVPGAHVLTIGLQLNFNFYSYLGQKSKIKYNYDYFKQILENTAKLFIDSGKEIYVYYSGGIDSSAILLALQKNSEKIHPMATSQDFNGSYDGDFIHEKCYLAEKELGFKSEIVYADRYSVKQRNIRDEICKKISSNNSRWDSFVFYSVMEHFKGRENCIFVSGEEMDDGYGVAYTKYYKGIIYRIKSKIGRYFYSKPYQNHLNGFINTKIRHLIYKRMGIKSPQMSPKEEYLSSMIPMREYQSDYFPLCHPLDGYDSEFIENYIRYKNDFFLKSALSNRYINQIQSSEINMIIRILRHYFSIPNAIRGTFCRDSYQKLITNHLPTEGPMVDFFTHFQLGWKDILQGKRYLYRYFKERTGKNFFKVFNPSKIKKTQAMFIPQIQDGNLGVRRANLGNFLSSEVFNIDFKGSIDLDHPSFLKYVDLPYIQRFIQQIYLDAKRGLLDYNELQNIYNLELFFQNVEQLNHSIDNEINRIEES